MELMRQVVGSGANCAALFSVFSNAQRAILPQLLSPAYWLAKETMF
jgi:hypothetical protein